MIFLGPLYQPKKEDLILAKSTVGILNAAQQFQMRLLNGLTQNGEKISIVNVSSVGTWPKQYKKLFLPSERWSFEGNDCYEVGSINLPFIKQWQRTRGVKKILKKLLEEENEVVIYSTYLPFLKAAYRLKRSAKVTLIVTDLPEFYDFGKTSKLKKFFRNRNNKKIYKCLSRVDRFVLLTEAMKEPLKVGERPYVVIEGICDAQNKEPKQTKDKEIVFYAGSLRSKFGTPQLVEGFRMLEKEDVELWLCGDGDSEEMVKAAAKEDERIKFYGYVTSERVQELRAQATVLINPRSNEEEYTKYSFPSKTMDYMASGIPVVMHKLSGVPDEYDEHLIYIQENSPKGIKEALEYVFAIDKDERREIGKRARKFVTENKTSYMQAQRLIKFIKSEL